MVQKTSIAWKVALAFLLGAAVVFAAPVMGAPAWAADESPMAGMAGEPGRRVGDQAKGYAYIARRNDPHGTRTAW